jgi:hypothetical protein
MSRAAPHPDEVELFCEVSIRTCVVRLVHESHSRVCIPRFGAVGSKVVNVAT